MISRRNLILSLSAVAASSVAGLRYVSGNPEERVVDVVYKCLGYLKLEQDGVNAFARDLVARNAVSTQKLKLLHVVKPILAPLDAAVLHFAALRHGEERIATLYLLSSDFFVNGDKVDESRAVRYLGFYDPFQRACSNPFPRSVPDELQT